MLEVVEAEVHHSGAYSGHRLTDTHEGRWTVRTSPVNLLPARVQLVMLSTGVLECGGGGFT